MVFTCIIKASFLAGPFNSMNKQVKEVAELHVPTHYCGANESDQYATISWIFSFSSLKLRPFRKNP